MKKHKHFHFRHLWLVLAAYGVWFAIFSGIEEILSGKPDKAFISFILGIIIFSIVGKKLP